MEPTVPNFLKAAAALIGVSNEKLSLATGIRPTRVERLLRGVTPLRPGEAVQILKAIGCPPQLLTEPVEAMASHSVLAAWLADCWHARSAPAARPSAYLTIDKMAIVFNSTDDRRLIATAQRWGAPAPSSYYKQAFARPGVRVEHAPQDAYQQIRRSSRIEFNPDRAFGKRHPDPDPAAGGFVSAAVRLLKPDGAAITKLDVALDLAIPFHDVHAVAARKRKLNLWLGPEGRETFYVGIRGSDCQFAIYDKRREQHDQGYPVDLASPLTRFEARLRRPDLSLLALPALANPFRELRLFVLRPDGLPLQRRLIVEYARFFGPASLRREMTPDEYAALCRDLEASNSVPLVPHPREIFEDRWDRIARSLLARLGLGGVP